MRRAMLALLVLSFLGLAASQGFSEGYGGQEGGPDITLRKCSSPGKCENKKLKLTMDANWRWSHIKGDYENCYKGNIWTDVGDGSCSGGDGAACAKQCDLESISADGYENTYGVTKSGDGVAMRFTTVHEYGTAVGARLYMIDGENYEMFTLVNEEFAFDADMSQLDCGMNGAVYFIEMQENGGKGIGNNQAGAKAGTGYCDAQCPHDMKFIDGEANVKGWKPNDKDKSDNMGMGHYGACCNEYDVWEANSHSQAYTPHPCSVPSLHRCEGMECGDNDKDERYKGVCDKDGCDFASWRMGAHKFYGRGSEFKVNTEKKLTQVQQFISHDGTANGDLVEIRRVWVQDGNVIENTEAPHMKKCIGAGTSLNDDMCKSQNEKFGDYNHFKFHGGHKVMGESLKRGHVLAISLWDDVDVSMMWLDSWYPRVKDRKDCPGISRGPCEGGETSTPMYVRKKYPDAVVTYTNFAVGCLGCTTPGVTKGPKAYKPVKDPEKHECPISAKCSGDAAPGNDNNNDDDDSRRRRRSKPPARRRRKGSRRRKSSTRRRRRSSSRRRRKSR